MKLNKFSITIIVLIICFSKNLFCQELKRPIISGAPFLNLPIDARSGGMGETGVATLVDPYSQYHNPSKYLFFFDDEKKGISISYIPQFLGYADDVFLANVIYYQNLNDRSSISGSVSFSNFGKVEIEEQMGTEIINQGNYNPNEFAIDLTYGLRLNNYFGMSITGRYIRSNISGNSSNGEMQYNSANAISTDISAFYTSAYNRGKNVLTFGVNLKNLGTKLNYDKIESFGYPLPTTLKVGGGYHIRNDDNKISLNLEIQKFLVPTPTEEGQIKDISVINGIFTSFTDARDGLSEEVKELIYHFGSEYNIDNTIFLRTGYTYQNAEKGMKNHVTFGSGFSWNRLLFDLAYQIPLNSYQPIKSGNALRVSISYDISN